MLYRSKLFKLVTLVLGILLMTWTTSLIVTYTCVNYKPRLISDVRTQVSELLNKNKLGNISVWNKKLCFIEAGSQGFVSFELGYLYKKSVVYYSNGIPNILHTTWKTNDLREKWMIAEDICRQANKKFIFCHWSDEDLVTFVALEYPELLERFLLYPYPIQRADVGRYLMLHKFGGFYRDVNVGCRLPLEKLYFIEMSRHRNRTNFLSSAEIPFKVLFIEGSPFGVAGDFLASAPAHSFFSYAVDNLKERPFKYGLPYLDVMMGTGPIFLSSMYSSFIANSSIAKSDKDELRVIPDDSFYRKYFYFLSGKSTWHCFDGVVFWWFFQHKNVIVFLSFCVVLNLIIYKLKHRNFKRIIKCSRKL